MLKCSKYSRDMRKSSSKVTSSWTCGSEGKKGSGGQSERKSQKVEGYERRGKEKEDIGVPLTTPRWDASRECHSFGGC